MKKYYFIKENSHLVKVWTAIGTGIILSIILFISLFFSAFFYKIISAVPFISRVAGAITENITNATIQGLFYAHLLGAIFFVPSLDEVVFYYGLVKGNPYLFAFLAAISGYMIAQVINYYLGSKISPFIMHLISKKKIYKTRRFVNRYGGWGIFIFNILPFPAPLLTFALGIAKYNFTRLFVITLLAKSCTYMIIIFAYFLFSR